MKRTHAAVILEINNYLFDLSNIEYCLFMDIEEEFHDYADFSDYLEAKTNE